MSLLIQVRRSACPNCEAELEPHQVLSVPIWSIWSMEPSTFRCRQCATMLRLSRRRRALPALCAWVFFFAPPVLLQAYYGSWAALSGLPIYSALSWGIGALVLLGWMLYGHRDVEKFSDE